MARKHDQLADPRLVEFYRTLGDALDRTDDDPRLVESADALAAYVDELAAERGEDFVAGVDVEPSLATLLDALAFATAPPARRLIELMARRGWTGWTRLERRDHRP